MKAKSLPVRKALRSSRSEEKEKVVGGEIKRGYVTQASVPVIVRKRMQAEIPALRGETMVNGGWSRLGQQHNEMVLGA